MSVELSYLVVAFVSFGVGVFVTWYPYGRRPNKKYPKFRSTDW